MHRNVLATTSDENRHTVSWLRNEIPIMHYVQPNITLMWEQELMQIARSEKC